MRKQRTLFLGRRPACTPRKDGDNPLVPDRRHRALDPEAIEIRFNNETATQFGGYPLLARFIEKLDLDEKLSQHIKMARGRLAFTAPELSRFLIDAKLLGASRLMHVECMRLDPMLTQTAGIDGLPSGKTLGVYLKSYQWGHLESLGRLNTRVLRQLWKRQHRKSPKPEVILDYDSTTITVYGQQQGADRGRSFRKKDKPGYQPKFAFIGGIGLMVHQRLEPQSHNLNKDFVSFHEETVRKMPKKAAIWGVRGDGALYSQDLIRYFEQQGYVYGISASRNEHLREAILALRDEDFEEGTDEQGRPYSIARIHFRPKTWDKARTFIVSRRLKEDSQHGRLFEGEQYKYFAYVTNRRGPLLTQFQFCVERCSLESFIKESKGGFDYDFLPCAEANANQAYLLHVQLAYNLAIFFKWQAAPRGVNRWTIATLRARILCICGNLRRCGQRWLLSLPSWWPYQSIFKQIERQAAMAWPA